MLPQEPAGSADRPLQGVRVCFTAINQHLRDQYADIAKEMGAEHKLDLTSDTTHLIVGDTDTKKYDYVAREREDMKVLRIEWIDAVRDHWINDLPLDLDALTLQYRMPTLAGLKICITGFDDLSFRAQLQKNVKDNGGQYFGDLTKDVTHLIAAKPEGKKYEYGMQWQKKVVSLKWYKDTLERGMRLDESRYHPTIPVAEQGIDAWNRKPRTSPQLGKRTREEPAGPEPSRKLRRTASARLGSQNQGMWSDIVGGAGFEPKIEEQPPLKASVSMPALRRVGISAAQDPGTRIKKVEDDSDLGASRTSGGLLTDCLFMVRCFDHKKESHLQNILVGLNATIIGHGEIDIRSETNKYFVILPHDLSRNKPVFDDVVIPKDAHVVSELWLEKCMLTRSFIPPESYPLGQVMKGSSSCLNNMTINASGFDGIENVHIIKLVSLLGGIYAKVFTPAISVLICKRGNAKKDKLELAQHLGIPVVSEDWLWAAMKEPSVLNTVPYLLQPIRSLADTNNTVTERHLASKGSKQIGATSLKQEPAFGVVTREATAAQKPVKPDTRPEVLGSSTASPNAQQESCSAVHEDGTKQPVKLECRDQEEDSQTQEGSCFQEKHVLRELSPTSARRNYQTSNNHKPQIKSLDGALSIESLKKESTKAETSTENGAKATDIAAINGAIRDILNERSRTKAAEARVTGETKRKGKLVGRALSNLSNSSSTSHVRQSRASSIDSMNTDGIGSEIISKSAEDQNGEAKAAAQKSSFSFTGRAKAPLAGLKITSHGLEERDLANTSGFDPRQETAPPMTQLGYEDPEESILLRKKLAAARKKGRKKDEGESEDQDQDDSTSDMKKVKTTSLKIRDDDILAVAEARWGAGKRTRHKRSPPGQRIQGF